MHSWRLRRRFMFLAAAFCMASVAWILYRDMRSEVAETAITMAFTTLSGIVGSYVFGAVWEDVSRTRHNSVPTRPQGCDTIPEEK